MAALAVRTCSRCVRRMLCVENNLPGKRYLLTNEYLKLDVFLNQKQATLYSYFEKKDVFFKRMELKLQNSQAILHNELKPMLYLCGSKSDVQLVKQCLQRYYEETDTTEYKFGPIFLRLCYELDLPDAAFELLMDEAHRDAFSDITSYNILLDILYKHGQHERALEALLEMKTRKVRFSKQTYLLAIANCYALNTPRSLEICVGLLEEALIEISPPRAALCFAVALALNQGDIEKAIYVFQKIQKKDHSLCCSLGLLIAARTENWENVLEILESANDLSKVAYLKKPEFSQEVMDSVNDKLKSTDLCKKFSDLYDQLKQSEQISTMTLHEMLLAAPREPTLFAGFKRKESLRPAYKREVVSS